MTEWETVRTLFTVVQHGEKMRGKGDVPLAPRGHAQAQRTGEYLRGQGVTQVVSSPLRRAGETAAHLAALALPVAVDSRARERMNWGDGPDGQALDAFLAEWQRATADRDWCPASGDSSRAAGERFVSLLDDLRTAHPYTHVVIVAHGGVTVDALRTLFGDDVIRVRDASLFDGVPPCAITRIRYVGRYALELLASVAHLE